MQDENAPENIDDMPVEDTEQLESNAGTDGLSSQLQDAEERVLRAQAEIENVRKRGRREYYRFVVNKMLI